MDSDEYEYPEKTSNTPKPEMFNYPVNGSDKIDKSENKGLSWRAKQKTDRHDEGFDNQMKLSRKGDYSHHRENDRSSSLLDRTSSVERERNERERHRHRRELKNRDIHRDSEDRNRKERDGDKTSERHRERYRDRKKRDHDSVYEREVNREREQEKSKRNRNHSERYRDEWDRERSREKGGSHDVEYKERERERERERVVNENEPESRRTKKQKEERAEPLVDPERDQRTVFAYQISVKADERDVYEFFSRAGKVEDVRLIMDRNTGRSKGVGYIEFSEVMSVPVAIALSGQLLLGQPVMVKPSEAEKNLVQSTTVAAGAAGLVGAYYPGEHRQLYVGNLHPGIKEDQLRQVFEPFGIIERVQLPSDSETGYSKGYGFVQFARLEDARAAQSLDGQLEIAGQVMKVSAVTDQAGEQEDGDSDNDSKLGCKATSASNTDPLGAAAGVLSITPFGQTPIPEPPELPAASFSIPAAVPSVYTIGVPSECLLLKNMFDPKVESEPDFEQDVKDDVEDQCTKFGDLKHIYVEKNSAGFVYLRFQNSQSAIAAQRALHGRWLAGKMITATFLVPETYEAKFPGSK